MGGYCPKCGAWNDWWYVEKGYCGYCGAQDVRFNPISKQESRALLQFNLESLRAQREALEEESPEGT